MTCTGNMLSNSVLSPGMPFTMDMGIDPGMHADLFSDMDLNGSLSVSLYDHPDHRDYSDDPMQQLLLQQQPTLMDSNGMAYTYNMSTSSTTVQAQKQKNHHGAASTSMSTSPPSDPFTLSRLPSSPPSPSLSSSPPSSPSPTQRPRRHRHQLPSLLSSSSPSLSSSAPSKAPSSITTANGNVNTNVNTNSNTNGNTNAANPHPALPRYPSDPDDWRARLRYCEAVRDKGQLTAAMVRLLDFPEALAPEEVAARRAGNLRLDRVREQRLKARNNSAAKRSRQRKVERIEAAEKLIAALQRERAVLQNEVVRLQRALVAKTPKTA